MDRDQALSELPPAYAMALRLDAAGAGRDLIATALGIEVEGVGSLLALAEAKVARVFAVGDHGAFGEAEAVGGAEGGAGR